MKKAFVTGINGQDGAYLALFLLGKGYEVHGMIRRSSLPNTHRLEKLSYKEKSVLSQVHLHYGDMTDSSNIHRLIGDIEPNEIYNLAAQSHVHVSFESPENTADVDALGTLRMLEAMRALKKDSCRFYQASTSELFGKIQNPIQSETTPFYPRSPYAVAKLYAYWITVNYRESYDLFACNGILFNHESPLRGVEFVTRKITLGVARIILGMQEKLLLGNLDSERDWGHAKDYVEMQWLMLQQDQARDYVIATGVKYSVREFVQRSFAFAGVEIEWHGKGKDEFGVIRSIDNSKAIKFGYDGHADNLIGRKAVEVDSKYFRPAEVDVLIGDAAMAKRELGWSSSTSLNELIAEMVEHDINSLLAD